MSKILMCPPTYFGIEYVINPWMDMANQVDKNAVSKQWNNLKDTLEEAGAEIDLIEPQQSLPDMVFTANAGLLRDNIFIPSRFKFSERQREMQYWIQWFQNAGYEVKEIQSELPFEGAGDALSGKVLFGGYGFRSSKESYKEIEEILSSEIIPLHLVDDRFYHLDTCFCPLNEESAILYEGAFDEESVHLLKEHISYFSVPEEEATRFACNAVVINKNVVLPTGCPETQKHLQSIGFTTFAVDMSEFLKSGGAAKCLTLKLF